MRGDLVGEDDLWYHHIGEFPTFIFIFFLLPPLGLPVGMEALPAGSGALPAGSGALPAGSEALPAGSKVTQLDPRPSQLHQRRF